MTCSGISAKEDTMIVDGHRLYVRRLVHGHGAGMTGKTVSGPVLVMLHEALGCTDMWHDFPEKLARLTGWDVLLYDRLGHGRSDPLPQDQVVPGYLEHEALTVLPLVLERCGVSDAVFWGHSDGGTLALLFAGRYPGGVRGVVTEAAHVHVDSLTLQGIKTAGKAWQNGDLRDRLKKYHGNNVDGIYHRWFSVWLSQAFSTWNVTDDIKGVTAPVLALQGDEDPYGEAEQVHSICRSVSGVCVRAFLSDCGHIPHFQARKAVMKAADDFFQTHTGRDYENPWMTVC